MDLTLEINTENKYNNNKQANKDTHWTTGSWLGTGT